MRIKNNLLIISILICISLIATIYLFVTKQALLSLTVFTVSAFAIYYALNVFLISRLEKNLNPTDNALSNRAAKKKAAYANDDTRISKSGHHLTDQPRHKQNKHPEYDQLTALPTYDFYLQILNKTIVQSKRHNKIFAILLIDLDNFDKIDFNLDKSNADQLLKQIGNRISNTLRAEDTIARFSYHQFIIILNDISKEKFAGSAAVKLLQSISQPIQIENSQPFAMTASIGVCVYPNDGEEISLLLKNSALALSKAQSAGGNVYEFFSPELDDEAHEFISLRSGLRSAIKNNEMSVFYQPKLNVRQGQIVGVEALIRWKHPQLGLISADKFITVAEETGFISELSEWAIEEACRSNKYWQSEGYAHISIAINLSAKQFFLPDIADRIQEILNKTQLSPQYLELEINESTAMQNIDLAVAQMNSLKKIGLQISLDHFGVGYTAISYLKLFPINSIKIDRLFIRGVPNLPNDCAITNALIALAHQLGFEVVAEGVEHAEQLAYLLEHDCDMIQGYYLGHPVPANKMKDQLLKLSEKASI